MNAAKNKHWHNSPPETVFTTSQKLATGVQSMHINVPAGLTPGFYVLEVTDGNNRLLQKKLLKQ
jgi:hypothetical protein